MFMGLLAVVAAIGWKVPHRSELMPIHFVVLLNMQIFWIALAMIREQAYELAKHGRFLIEELYSDWARQHSKIVEEHYRMRPSDYSPTAAGWNTRASDATPAYLLAAVSHR